MQGGAGRQRFIRSKRECSGGMVTAKEEQRHHCYTTPLVIINEICGREWGVSPALLWRCKYLVVCCFKKFLKYLLNIGLFLVIHCNAISPRFCGDSWSHINSFSLLWWLKHWESLILCNESVQKQIFICDSFSLIIILVGDVVDAVGFWHV